MNTHSVLYLQYGQCLCFVEMENDVLLEISETTIFRCSSMLSLENCRNTYRLFLPPPQMITSN